MDAPKTILVVDDEPHIVLGLKDALEFEGFRVVTAATGTEAITEYKAARPDAVLLDLMLPDQNGYQVCQRLRELDAQVPVIMLTAKSQEADKIRGLDSGADDYVTKPFSVGELTARLRALFRRTDARQDGQIIVIGDATINVATHTLSCRGQEEMLTFYEVELLRLLHERRGEPVSRDDILKKVWGIEKSGTSRTIDNFIVKLRKKIEDDPGAPRFLVTVHGYGYRFAPKGAS